MNQNEIVKKILTSHHHKLQRSEGYSFAPTNIALAKYWGKRDIILNLPQTSSLSITLPEKGAFTYVKIIDEASDCIILNGKNIHLNESFAKRIINFLDLFRPTPKIHFRIETQMNIPVSAGLASSACGFAALTQALNHLLGWKLDKTSLSLLARLGSGSACRSLWPGFVKWQAGKRKDGLDSYAEPLNVTWPDLHIGLLTLSSKMKSISSKQAMQQTVATSPYYSTWYKRSTTDIAALENAIKNRDFELFGKTTEANALAMHATFLTTWPPLLYWVPETVRVLEKIWLLRASGIQLFFTQDAGPNIKLLFLSSMTQQIQKEFPKMDLLTPFLKPESESQVILVDTNDRAIGHIEKLQAHQKGLCHRAFSVFIFRRNNGGLELLLQQRHPNKYHGGNLWTNTCCSHPHPGENIIDAAQHRLKIEMGLTTSLMPCGKFHYTAKFPNGLIENEVDHVFIGFANPKKINPDTAEVIDYQWIDVKKLQQALQQKPNDFTPWLKQGIEIALLKTIGNQMLN